MVGKVPLSPPRPKSKAAPPLTEAEFYRIKAYLREGMAPIQIRFKFGFSLHQIDRARFEPKFVDGRATAVRPARVRDQIEDMHNRLPGLPRAMIAQRLHCSRHYVDKVLGWGRRKGME